MAAIFRRSTSHQPIFACLFLAAGRNNAFEPQIERESGVLFVIVRHILPNIIQPVIVQAAIGMAGAILAEATMSFLGLGVPPPTASWGAMLNDGRAHLFDAPHLVLFPALAVMLAVLSFNFIGDALRDYLDPRSRIEAGL